MAVSDDVPSPPSLDALNPTPTTLVMVDPRPLLPETDPGGGLAPFAPQRPDTSVDAASPAPGIVAKPVPLVPPRIQFLAWLGLAGIAEFVLAVLALHAMSGGPSHLSDFARSDYPWLWVAGAYSFAVGGIALTLALKPHLRGSPLAATGLGLLWVASLGALVIATFPTDATPQAVTLAGAIHNDAVWPTFGSLGVAMVVIGPALRRHPSWRRFADFSVVLGLLVCAAGIAYVLTELHGLALVAVVQRLLVAMIACWFVILGANLLTIKPHSLPRPAAGAEAVEFRGPAHKG